MIEHDTYDFINDDELAKLVHELSRRVKAIENIIIKNNLGPQLQKENEDITINTSAENPIICPTCKSSMVLHEGKYGKFWGCSSFPKCRTTGAMKNGAFKFKENKEDKITNSMSPF
jgi:ribosomal protein L37AE/L43A